MGWLNGVKIVFRTTTNTVLDATASVLTTTGTVACAVGGAGFAAAQIIDRMFESAYYGAGHFNGGVDVNLSIPGLDINYKHAFPFHEATDQNGGAVHSLKDLMKSDVVRWGSWICVSGGVLLNSLGNTLKARQQHNYDAEYNRNHYLEIELPDPTIKDYLLVNARSFCNSISVAALSYSLLSCIDQYTNVFRDSLDFTYPVKGNARGQGIYYDGPIVVSITPFNLGLISEDFTFTIPALNLTEEGHIDASLSGNANISYGAGFSFKANAATSVPSEALQSIAAVLGVSAHVAGSFFARKERYRIYDKAYDAQQQMGGLVSDFSI